MLHLKKNPLKSRTLWGIALTVAGPYLPGLLTGAGIDNPEQVVGAAGTLLGAAVAVYGRFKAVKLLA